jgi:hypothetical protein
VAVEYSTVIEASPYATPTCYVTQNHLGSTRMLMDDMGSANVRRYDYQPFGTDLLAGIGSRTVAQEYQAVADDRNLKFTGQERDAETTLDWFSGAAYEWGGGAVSECVFEECGADSGDPQSWNGYSSVGNNPAARDGRGWARMVTANTTIW